MSSGPTSRASAVLATARRLRAEADAAEAGVLIQAAEWAEIHETSDVSSSAVWGDCPVPIAGEGAPLVSEFCVHELAAALGLSSDAGRHLIAHAVELAHRLPRCWARVAGGSLQVWKARRIAEATLSLSPEAAAFVDAQVAQAAHKIGRAALDRLVEDAIARFDPARAQAERDRAAEGRHLTIDHTQVSFAGTCRVWGELDLPDAQDLDAAVAAGAARLKGLGCGESLDVRRALAIGEIARNELALDLSAGFAAEQSVAAKPVTPTRPRRDAVLYLHLSAAALEPASGSASGCLENGGPHLVTAETVRDWLGVPGTRVSVRPVIDLNQNVEADGYAIPDALRERVELTYPTCTFPWCTRPARRCDLDHVEPFDSGGRTASENLAPLCRRHHRLKTFSTWRPVVERPGVVRWTSPSGYQYRRDPGGTVCLTPEPVPRRPSRSPHTHRAEAEDTREASAPSGTRSSVAPAVGRRSP